MKRRSLLTAGVCLGASGCAWHPNDVAQPTFVLVHGAWHGAWCWERVTPLLRGAGYRSVAVTLPGLAERHAELSPSINLDSHVNALLETIRSTPGPVVLVGHSYGGFVITGAVNELNDPRKLRSLIYLDAFVPQPGEKAADYMSPDARAKMTSSLAGGDAAYAAVPARFFGIERADDIAWVQSHLTAQPAGTYLQSLRPAAQPAHPKHSYIACQAPRLTVFDATKQRIRLDPSWSYRELQTGHDAMVTAPLDLSRLLVALA